MGEEDRSSDQGFLEDLARAAVLEAEEHGFEDVVAKAMRSRVTQIRFAKNQVTVVNRWDQTGLNIFLARDKRVVSSTLEDVSSEKAVRDAVNQLACFSSSIGPNQDYGGVAEGPFGYKPVPGLFDPRVIELGEKGLDLVEAAIQAAIEEGAKESAGVLLYGSEEEFLLTNHQVEAWSRSTRVEFTIRSFVDPKASGQGVSVGRNLGSISCEQAGGRAGLIAKMSVNARGGKPGVYDVVMSPLVAASIIGANATAANPFAIEAGYSWLKDRVNTRIGSSVVTMVDDGRVANGLGSREFDDEGVPTGRTVLVESGILRNLIHNTSTAKRNKTKTTGNAGLVVPENHNILISPGEHSFEELLEEASQPAIYVTSNWYTRFTSQKDGVFSTIPRDGMFIIEKGELGRPVRELRISDNMLRILANVVAVGKEVEQVKWWEVQTPTFAPPLLVKGVNLTTGTRES